MTLLGLRGNLVSLSGWLYGMLFTILAKNDRVGFRLFAGVPPGHGPSGCDPFRATRLDIGVSAKYNYLPSDR